MFRRNRPNARATAPAPSSPLPPGTEAPDFTLPATEGENVTLRDLRGQPVVLVFYPGDNTPGCTKQLCAIRDDFSKFEDAETVVFGINPQSALSHKKFVKEHKFPFPLLVDKDEKVIKAYGAKGPVFTQRTVYGIDKKGKIVLAKRGSPTNSVILRAFKKDKGEAKEEHKHESSEEHESHEKHEKHK